jgi:BirA family transcriptional regulator, biotin operon repressor / biotin---[acetyl-CoA-carboxylase] ligase
VDELRAQQVLPALTSARYGRSLRALDSTGSTNDDARDDALAGAVSGHVVLADVQSRGRGSSGRSWASPPGLDLYLSIVDRPPLALPQLPPLTLAVGLGVAHAVERSLSAGARCEVKWPNDVLLGGKKCAGILVESSTVGDAIELVVIGIGLNVNRLDFPDELSAIATSLRAARPDRAPLDRLAVLVELLASVEREVDHYVVSGSAAVARALEARLAWVGRRVRCGDVEGVLRGVSDSGALRLQTPEGMRELHSGRLVALEPGAAIEP